jgi:hypothetical protein
MVRLMRQVNETRDLLAKLGRRLRDVRLERNDTMALFQVVNAVKEFAVAARKFGVRSGGALKSVREDILSRVRCLA